MITIALGTLFVACGDNDVDTQATEDTVAEATRDAREEAENALGAALARLDRGALPPAVRDELADAEQLAALGRVVHNDAVRDALALRTHRLVRWFRLAAPPRRAPAPPASSAAWPRCSRAV